MNDKTKIEVARQIISDFYDSSENSASYKQGIIDAIWTILNMPEPPKED